VEIGHREEKKKKEKTAMHGTTSLETQIKFMPQPKLPPSLSLFSYIT